VAVAAGKAPGIHRDSPVPLHYQLRHLLVGMIERGEIRPGDVLPPERDLAAQFGVSLAPVRQAILDLVKEGVLYRVRGKGTFLREPSLVEHDSILSSFTASMREKGLEAEMRLVRQKSIRTTRQLADALRSSEPRTLLLERVALVQDEPVALFASLLIARGTSFDAQEEAIEHFHVHYRADRIRLRLDSYRFAEQVVPTSGQPARRRFRSAAQTDIPAKPARPEAGVASDASADGRKVSKHG
jgi:GntR family transcriptional regulator